MFIQTNSAYLCLIKSNLFIFYPFIMNLFAKTSLFVGVGMYLAACSTPPAGQPVTAGNAQTVDSTKAAEAKTLAVDIAASKLEWEGTKTGGKHNGSLMLKSGSLQVKGKELVGGSFVLDMNSIKVLDLTGKEAGDLEGHLKNKDFFETNVHAEGKFVITGVKAGATDPAATHTITGNLTLKGVEKSVDLPAKVDITDAGLSASTPQFTIDRQVWGINYKSSMKDVVLNDQMGIKITLVAK